MPIPPAKLAKAKARLRAKSDATMVLMRWTEWPNGQPDIDPTTGARPVIAGNSPVSKTANVRAFVHIVAPITSGYRKFSEIQSGDCVLDFPLEILRITDAGGTNLTVGQIVDEITFSQANRAAGEDTAMADPVDVFDLSNASFEFGGHTWVQKEVGEELARNWDTIYAGINMTRAMLLTTTK